MRKFDKGAADTYLVDRVEVARWEQYSLGDRLPFQAMWYTVPPRASSPRDCHPEVELSIVVSGSAVVETGGLIAEVDQGSAFLLDSNEAHVVHNHSTDVPLVVYSAYWMPAAAGANAAAEQAGGEAAARAAATSHPVATSDTVEGAVSRD